MYVNVFFNFLIEVDIGRHVGIKYFSPDNFIFLIDLMHLNILLHHCLTLKLILYIVILIRFIKNNFLKKINPYDSIFFKRKIVLKNISFYSHSIVAGGLELISYTTLLIPLTRLMISLEMRASNS